MIGRGINVIDLLLLLHAYDTLDKDRECLSGFNSMWPRLASLLPSQERLNNEEGAFGHLIREESRPRVLAKLVIEWFSHLKVRPPNAGTMV